MKYNQQNQHQRDSLLSFDEESHTYTHRDGQQFESVTTFIERQFPQFDADYWAPRKAAQLGITAEEIKAEWDRKAELARNLGTLMHARIEGYYLGEQPLKIKGFPDGPLPDDDGSFARFLKFKDHFRLNPYRTEWAIFDEELHVAGTLDFLDYTDGRFTIYDWKRSDKVVRAGQPITVNSFHQTGLGKVSHLDDTSYWHYALQTSLYRLILERRYGIHVDRQRLGVFHPNNPTYYVVETPYLLAELQSLFNL